MKDLIQTKVTVNTGRVSDIYEFSRENENVTFSRDEFRNKDKIINIWLENLFEREITSISYKNNSVTRSQKIRNRIQKSQAPSED